MGFSVSVFGAYFAEILKPTASFRTPLSSTLGVLIFAGTNFREFRDFCKTS